MYMHLLKKLSPNSRLIFKVLKYFVKMLYKLPILFFIPSLLPLIAHNCNKNGANIFYGFT